MGTIAHPLHRAVWEDDVELLERLMQRHKEELEKKDSRGRTPLHLAATLGRTQCARVLLANNADPLVENGAQYSVLHEAVSTCKPELVEIVLQARDFHQSKLSASTIPRLLEIVQSSPDFYVEMKWEFTSWVPFLSHMCPNDTYKIWKKGANVRVDTTLLGFDNMHWIRGNRRFVFKGGSEEAVFMEIDLDNQTVQKDEIQLSSRLDPILAAAPHPKAVKSLLTKPSVSTIFTTENIGFTRCKSGLPGFRANREETINGYPSKVFSASNVEFVTRTRTDHLANADKKKIKGSDGFQKLFGWGNDDKVPEDSVKERGRDTALSHEPPPFESNPRQLTENEYFNPQSTYKLGDYDIGRKPEVNVSSQKFKATLWMAENFPLSLSEQVLPIIELLAANISHFARLRDFVQLHLPAGFPVKIEIPLFHVLNACVTFCNVNGTEGRVDGVHMQPAVSDDDQEIRNDEDWPVEPTEGLLRNRRGVSTGSKEETVVTGVQSCECDSTMECVVDMDMFDIPPGLSAGGRVTQAAFDDDDELLQFAIQQSLLESDQAYDVQFSEQVILNEEDELQRAIQQSMTTGYSAIPVVPKDDNLSLALQLSLLMSEEEERLRKQEEEELEKVLKLSMAQQ